MIEPRIKKGLFRLWIVVSVCWVSYIGIDLYDEYLRMQNAIQEYERVKGTETPPTQVRMADETDLKYDPDYTYSIGYSAQIRPSSPAVVRSNFERTFLSHLTGMFVAPLGLLLLFYIITWVAKGFIKRE